MRLRLLESQKSNFKAQKLSKKDSYKKVDEVLHHQGLFFMPEAIQTKFINRHHDNFPSGHFGIKIICKLKAWKYYWPILYHYFEAYVKDCDVCLASKAI